VTLKWRSKNVIKVDIVQEVRRNREHLTTLYGGMEGWIKKMEEERPLLEAQG